MSIPPMRALQVFEAVGRLGSVTLAARELGVTAGAVSQQIKILERYFGCTLISRRGRQVCLSASGATYHAQVTVGFQSLAAASAGLQRRQSAAGLVVSALPSFMIRWLSSQIFRWQERNRGVRLRFESSASEPDLERDGVDFRVTYGECSDVHPHTRKLFVDRVVPVCSPNYVRSHAIDLQRPEDLCKVDLIHIDWRPEFEGAPSWDSWFELQGINVNCSKGASYSLTTLAIEAAVSGRGVALGQVNFIERELASKQLIRLFDKEMPLREAYYVAWTSIALEKPGGREFLNWILSVPVQ